MLVETKNYKTLTRPMINQKGGDEEDDEVHEEVVYGPEDEPWGCREIHVRDHSGHIFRFGQSIPA